jgi:hypothetical protein
MHMFIITISSNEQNFSKLGVGFLLFMVVVRHVDITKVFKAGKFASTKLKPQTKM